ncbi:beta-ketoacyl-[acyl-carrier-protein] synthase family protein [Pararobbsia silviterrae]|uniref:Beta-ketoacyl-[acyl-carrier-protein] synthase family protein n=1 Tax=Pararobbsia silviterrae TaxID=1792498 RepID=A0A494X7R2_9BURK|nr:beta-ketoacyl-[acyl-carrier-protein] synthase family protein [Pararobbsia silviterrae]RKP46598.1 beta-ketoacyl-[acyl-carrier-protein] synthase family protein [Pararobbsia silviterrae]
MSGIFRPVTLPLRVSRFTATSCVGEGNDALRAALHERRGGLVRDGFAESDLDTWLGPVANADTERIDGELAPFDCRNNRLARIGLAADGFLDDARDAVRRHGAHRVGVILGTSTGGVLETELAYRRRLPSGALPPGFDYSATHSPYSVVEYVRALTGARGPSTAVSSACSSSAKVFASAARLIATGLIDAAIVGGVDSLCQTTLYGFNSLELLSSDPCRPYDPDRNGISISEGAAFALLERWPGRPDDDAIALVGYGESSDAHHMSSPHPEGLGAQIAMRAALTSAGLDAGDIDYINLHGTATPSNDAAEGLAVSAVFGATPCSSTKGATGHTLGAAGALEAVISILALRHHEMPAGINSKRVDPALNVHYLLENRAAEMRYVLSNSFGFGGTNCSLIFANVAGVSDLLRARDQEAP